MSPSDIINKYNGKKHIGTNDSNKGQCVGLFEQVMGDLGLGFVPGNAKDLFGNADPAKFQKITNNPNDPNQLPPAGSWLIFGAEPWNGYLGHVLMVVSSAVQSFVGLEQNNPAGDDKVSEVNHTTARPYAGVIGWLIPNQSNTPTPVAVPTENGGWATAINTCNVRSEPSTNGNITSVLSAGSRFQYIRVVKGQNVSGIDDWVQSVYGHFIWAKNVAL